MAQTTCTSINPNQVIEPSPPPAQGQPSCIGEQNPQHFEVWITVMEWIPEHWINTKGTLMKAHHSTRVELLTWEEEKLGFWVMEFGNKDAHGSAAQWISKRYKACHYIMWERCIQKCYTDTEAEVLFTKNRLKKVIKQDGPLTSSMLIMLFVHNCISKHMPLNQLEVCLPHNFQREVLWTLLLWHHDHRLFLWLLWQFQMALRNNQFV